MAFNYRGRGFGSRIHKPSSQMPDVERKYEDAPRESVILRM